MSKQNTTKGTSRSRRKFLIRAAVGTGVVLGLGYVGCAPVRRVIATQVDEADLPYSIKKDPQLWFEITADNKIIFNSPKVEMGQGVFTGLAQLAAEELEVEIDRIQMVHAGTQTGIIDPFATGGSMTRMVAASSRSGFQRPAMLML
ncbi:MAG: molybdopterin cofactor-binding domain-containing protein, partial [Bacteroidota bacterium]